MCENFGNGHTIIIKIIFFNFKRYSYTFFPECLIIFYFLWVSVSFLPNRFKLPWNIIHVRIPINRRKFVKSEGIVTRVYDNSIRACKYGFEANALITDFLFIFSFCTISNATYAINVIGVKDSTIVHK